MILVTGATGMLGGHLIWHLLRENSQIIAIKRDHSDVNGLKRIFQFYGSDSESLFRKIIWRTANVEEYQSLIEAMEGVEYVYHCAAVVDLGKGNSIMFDVNVDGTKNIVKAALTKGIKKLCFVSSIAALPNGNEGGDIIDESTPFADNEKTSIYGESKRLSEAIVSEAIGLGMDVVIVNPGVILGYSKNKTGSGELFKRVKGGMPFYTTGISGYVAVEDVARAMILLMKSAITRQQFVLVGENKTHKSILSHIAHGYNRYRPFINMDGTLVSCAKLFELLARFAPFTPPIDVSSAITAISKREYSSHRFLKAFPDFKFTPIDKAINRICKFDNQA